jgi:photosystem II stability/assembly factor-like uncharacterized protein
MLTSIRNDVRWTLCEKLLLSLVIVCLLVLSGFGGSSSVSVAQAAHEWEARGAHQAVSDVLSLAIDPADPSTVYAGVRGGGVFKSSDGGGTWTAINDGLPAGIVVNALAVDRQIPSTLYAGANQGVFKSTNGGEVWEAATPL